MSEYTQDFAHSPVSNAARKGFFPILIVMLGFTFFSASMWSGGTLGQGLAFPQLMATIMAGNLLLGVYTSGLAYAGSKTGLSTHLLAQYAFGQLGARIISFVLAATQVGWFSVGVAMFALPVNKVTGFNLEYLILISGVLMTATAFFGFKALTILSFLAVPAIAVLGSYSINEALTSVGGLSELMNIQPENTISFAAAISICIGSFISGGTLTADFTRFAQTPKMAVIATLIAFAIGNTLMFAFGAIGSIATGQADVAEVMFLQGLIIPAIITLGLNIWTTNDNALYVSGLGFASLTGWNKNYLVLINGTLGTLLALWTYNNFVGWLTLLSSALPPIGAIILADFFILHKRYYPVFETTSFSTINPDALVALTLGVAAAFLLPGIPPVNAVLAAGASHVLWNKCGLNNFLKQEA